MTGCSERGSEVTGEIEIGSNITGVEENEREKNKKGERENARWKESGCRREKRKSGKKIGGIFQKTTRKREI